jgi:Na+/proline symporter
MWAAPLIVPGLGNADDAYVEMGIRMLPAGLVGLVLAGFFSHTMAMVSSDANVISAVITRDMLPRIWKGVTRLGESAQLQLARITTFLFIAVSMLIAISTSGTGVVIKIVVDVVAATVGVIGIPLLLGLLPWFRRSGPRAALSAVLLGLGVWAALFIAQKTGAVVSKEALVAYPILTSTVIYVLGGLLLPERAARRDELIDTLGSDDPAPEAAAAK